MSGKQRIRHKGLLSNNLFLLIISIICAIGFWYKTSADNMAEGKEIAIYDVEIELQKSDAAQADGLMIYHMSQTTADIQVSSLGQNSKGLSSSDFTVVGTFSPSSTKVSGTGLQTATIKLRAVTKDESSTVEIVSVEPSEIVVEYDKNKELLMKVGTDEIKYAPDSGYFAATAVLSEDEIAISGPESYINRIGRASVVKEITTPLKQDYQETVEVQLYDKDEKLIPDYSAMYLSLSAPSLDVSISVLKKKTLRLEKPALINAPESFALSRIKVTPETIEVAGDEAVLDTLDSISLGDSLNMADVGMNKSDFRYDIVLPSGVSRNISGTEVAVVSVDLKNFKEIEIPVTNFNAINYPSSKEVVITTKELKVKVIVAEAQADKITAESIVGTIDMTGKTDNLGSRSFPVSFTIGGGNNCWISGSYTIDAEVRDASVTTAQDAIQNAAANILINETEADSMAESDMKD